MRQAAPAELNSSLEPPSLPPSLPPTAGSSRLLSTWKLQTQPPGWGSIPVKRETSTCWVRAPGDLIPCPGSAQPLNPGQNSQLGSAKTCPWSSPAAPGGTQQIQPWKNSSMGEGTPQICVEGRGALGEREAAEGNKRNPGKKTAGNLETWVSSW